MGSGFRTGGNSAAIDEGVRKTILSLKEIVGNHSDADIYAALKEANMVPDEAVQKLLNQDPFHEVKRKRDKKKEVATSNDTVDVRKQSDSVGQGMKFRALPDRYFRRGAYTRNSAPRNSFPLSVVPRNSVPRNPIHGTNKEFRVVRDNRSIVADGDSKIHLPQSSGSNNDKAAANVNENGSTGAAIDYQPSGARNLVHYSNGPIDSRSWQSGKAPSGCLSQKEVFEEEQYAACCAVPIVRNAVTISTSLASNNSIAGVYSSSTDPVHVPSPDSRSSSVIGAIKREIRNVGVGRKSSENAAKGSFVPSGASLSNSFSRKDGDSQSYRPFSPISKADRLTQTTPETLIPNASSSRSFFNSQHGNRSSQYGNRMQQQVGGHQKVPSQNKEWKPKSSQKSGVSNPGVIGTPKKSHPAKKFMNLESEAAKLEDKLSSVNINESQNVIIADHIRVLDVDRCQLTFGSFGPEFDSSRNSVSGTQEVNVSEETNLESAPSLSVSAPEPSTDDVAASKPVDVVDDQVRHIESDSQVSSASEQQLPEKRVSSVQNVDDYADIGLIRGSSPSYAPSESKQQHDPTELQSFPAYDPQSGYDIPYFRPTMDETFQGQELLSPQEALNSHPANSIPASTMAMLQQQQAPVAQIYPQVHVSHFPNLMPYRQFLSPVFVPQMPMPGYSGNPAYPPHPSNGSSYLLMPGGSSHLNANGLKYGIQQFKPVPTGSPTGFGNYSNPTGYPINSPGVVGNATGLEDSSRIKYKDGNIYVPNPQAETSEMWIQNPRDLSGLQTTPYYNVTGQTPHGAYLPSHTGHASFNAAAAQSSHMQFQGLFHAPQPSAMAGPHHMGPTMGGNIGVGVAPPAPAAQVGTYQQPQLGHLNWPANF